MSTFEDLIEAAWKPDTRMSKDAGIRLMRAQLDVLRGIDGLTSISDVIGRVYPVLVRVCTGDIMNLFNPIFGLMDPPHDPPIQVAPMEVSLGLLAGLPEGTKGYFGLDPEVEMLTLAADEILQGIGRALLPKLDECTIRSDRDPPKLGELAYIYDHANDRLVMFEVVRPAVVVFNYVIKPTADGVFAQFFMLETGEYIAHEVTRSGP